MIVVGFTALGLVVGEVVRRRLNRLSYRLPASETDDHDETLLPTPGSRWWIPIVLAAAWGGTAWSWTRDGTSTGAAHWASPVGWLVFSCVGLWLSVIDLDVQRLPDRGQLVLAGAALVCGTIATWGEPIRLITGLVAGLCCGLAFLVIHMISRGALGLGDVKLVITCGFWLGIISVPAVFLSLVTSCVLAITYSLIARQRQFAFGPWLVAGTFLIGQYNSL